MRRLFLILIAATVPLGCNEPSPSTTALAPKTTSPAPVSQSATPAALEVNSFSLDELLEKAGSGCSILLKRSPDDADYIFHERLTGEGRGDALMKIEGDWVTFLPDSAIEPASSARAFTSEAGDFTLIAETPLGDRTGYEVTEIPSATLEIQYQDEAVTTLSAVGESGC